MFEIFSALEYLMGRECENLSGGEQQMVAISRALLGSPGLDSSSTSRHRVLAPENRPRRHGDDPASQIRGTLGAGGRAKCDSVHCRVSDRAYVMDHGRVVLRRRFVRVLLENQRAARTAAGDLSDGYTHAACRTASRRSTRKGSSIVAPRRFDCEADFTHPRSPASSVSWGRTDRAKPRLFELITGSNQPTGKEYVSLHG